MINYNRKLMLPPIEYQNETLRARKRDLKEAYKKWMTMNAHKAKFLPVHTYMEDF